MRCEFFAHPKESGFPEKFCEDWFGPCESVERATRGHLACGKAEAEEADGSSSRVSILIPLHGVGLSTMATLQWAEGVWVGKWKKSGRRRGGSRTLGFKHGEQVRGPAGAVMRETRDLGVKWLLFEGQVEADAY